MTSPAISSAILLVEDEPVLRTSMARGLGKLANVEVLVAGTYAEAVALLDSHPPSLIISDIDLPGGSGLGLVSEVQRRAKRIPIIFVTAYLRTYRPQIPDHPDVQVLEKPVPLEDLRRMVTDVLGPSAATRPAPFTVADYVQLACLGRHSVRIDVESPTGAAYVIVHEGEVWTAVDSAGSGPEAFARLAFATHDATTCSSLPGEPGERTISSRWESLALQSACAFEEAERQRMHESPNTPSLSRLPALGSSPPPLKPPSSVAAGSVTTGASVCRTNISRPNAPPARHRAPAPRSSQGARPSGNQDTIASSRAPASFEEMWSDGVEALLAREFTRAVRSFLAADRLRPNEPRVVANLQRLHDMGYVDSAELAS
jgi:CheY-like chemotaxis protein